MTGTRAFNADTLDLAKLPAVPHVLLKLIDCCQQEGVRFDDLSRIIRQDPALTARVVSIARSSALAQWNHLEDLNRILVVLGVDVIRTIAITTAVGHYFSQLSPQASSRRGRLWRASITCAHTAQHLARLTSYPRPEEAYLTGLLHNIGQLVLLHQHAEEYHSILDTASSQSDLERNERGRFGATSPELGAWLVRDWAPDSFISDAIRYQREPAERLGDTPRLVQLINLAHKLQAPDIDPDGVYAEADRLFGLSMSMIEQLRAEVLEQVTASAQDFGIRLDEEGQAQLEDETIHHRLGQQVKNFALMHGLGHGSAPLPASLESAWGTVLHNLNLLFGMKDALAFTYDPQGGRLRGVAAGRLSNDALKELSITLEGSDSIIARSLGERRILDLETTPEPWPVIDQQLRDKLGGDTLLSIPLIGPWGPLGAIAAASPQGHKPSSLLESFRQGATETLQSFVEAAQARQRLFNEQQEQWQTHQRKLVHEAGNPLGVIQNYLHLLSHRLQDEAGITDQLQLISDEIDRVGGILLRLKEPPHTASPGDQGATDVNALIRELFTIYQESLFATHRIHGQLHLDPDLPPFSCNINSLKQVIINLLKNAVEALPQGGTITLQTRGLNVGGDPFVEIRIGDDGPGVAGEILPRLFTPIKSEKGGPHSGLGLTIVANLVAQLKGTISCNNRNTGGAEFVVRLPRE